jgi:branched-chain amino acid transport system substrate-binding protein
MTTRSLTILAASISLLMPFSVQAELQGVTSGEILIGTTQDLSGPLAGIGKDAINGLTMRITEINEQGGVHGRKLRLLTEDNGYDPKKAVLAVQKLVNQDKVFMMVYNFGTAMNMASMPIMFSKNVINFLPASAVREMYEPTTKLKWSLGPSYLEGIRQVLPSIFAEKKATRACALYQDDDFGLEALHGAEQGLSKIGAQLGEKTTFKRGATDFSSQVARLRADKCDFVVLGTAFRETVGAVSEMRKLNYNPTLVATLAAYTPLVPKLGGTQMDGIYAVMFAQHPYLDDPSQPVRAWANKYQAAFGAEPTVNSVYSYTAMDVLVNGLQKTGQDLTVDNFAKAVESMSMQESIFGIPAIRFSAQSHLGTSKVQLAQLQNGRWVKVPFVPAAEK